MASFGLEREVARLITATRCEGAVRELIDGALLDEGGARGTLADMLPGPELAARHVDPQALRLGMLRARPGLHDRFLREISSYRPKCSDVAGAIPRAYPGHGRPRRWGTLRAACSSPSPMLPGRYD